MAVSLSSNAEAATIVATVSGPTTVNIGATVTVDLSITGWTDGEVDAVSFNLGFDQNIITYQSHSVPTAGSFLDDNQQGGANLVGTIDVSNVGGGVWGYQVDDQDLVSDPNTGATQAAGSLGSVTFVASNLGTSNVIGSAGAFLEPFDIGRGFFGGAITPGSLTYSGVDITVIPEPTPALLLLVGLTAGCLRRSRSAVQ